ncbi:MAG: EAL domain-containing protein [Nocardioides sp.]
MMRELLRHPLSTSADVAVAGRLTAELARESGLPDLERTNLASVVLGLARRAVVNAGPAEVVVSLDASARTGTRLVVTVSNVGAAIHGNSAGGLPAENGQVRLSRDLRELGPLVDALDFAAGPGGGVGATATVQLSTEAAADPELGRRLASVDPSRWSASDPTPAALIEQLAAQATELETVYAEIERVKEERKAAHDELALTNRGVLDLIAELSAANESLTISGSNFRQLADQQAALADLGHRAVVSRDLEHLARGLVGVLRRVLGLGAVAVLRFDQNETNSLDVVATEGCRPDQPRRVALGHQQTMNLIRTGTSLTDPAEGQGDFPILIDADSRSCAVVALHTPGGAWGVLVAYDSEVRRFTDETTAFLEAAVSVFAFAIARLTSEEVAVHAASHDDLTGLPNRSELLQYLTHTFESRLMPAVIGPDAPQTVVIYIDIDGFKQVNDSAGHAAGDAVLVEVSERLRSRTRPSDILARLGGDEFVAVCEGDAETAAAISKQLLTAFDDPFVIDGREVFLSGSAGFAIAAAGVASEQILNDADIAMYQAKQTPGSATAAFHPQMREVAESQSRMHSELRRARQRGQLRAVFQPIVGLDVGTVRAVEALLRWRHPVLGDVPAERTVAAAAKIGLSWDHTCWIAAEAAGAVSAWNSANPEHPPLRLAVNFTPLLLGDSQRIADFAATVTGAGLPFDLMDVELTETAFADPTPSVLASMAELRRLGARVAMDDFGTGYSSLHSLVNLPFDVLKIDRSFVSALDNGGDGVLVSAMTMIARSHVLETIGEGIETPAQLVALMTAGCDLGQGYLFARPLEREQMGDLAALESVFCDTVQEARAATPSSSDRSA